MAENDQEDRSTEDLSDEASPYRLEEFRKQGRVAQSRELTGMIVLLATGVGIYLWAPTIGIQISEFMREVFRTDLSSKMDLGSTAAAHGILMKAFKLLGWLTLPVGLIGFAAGAASSFVQTGAVFSTEPLNPDITRLDPMKGMQRFFTMKQGFDTIRLLLRFSIVTFIAYLLIKSQVMQAPTYGMNEPGALLGIFGSASKGIFISLCGVLIIFSGFDYWIQRWEFGKSVRLTKQEAKQEQKEHEGDPLLKARVRSIQRDAARKRMMAAVKKADVIVTNPTHIAIAITYEKDDMAAPKVVAKGADFMAQKIKAIAIEAGVPLVENVPLARTLFKTVKVGQYVPRSLYQAVAEVLAYVYRLKNRKS